MKILTGFTIAVLSLAILAGCSGSNGKDGAPGEPAPAPTPVPEDTFPNGSWQVRDTGSGSFIGSVLNVSNDGSNLSFYNFNGVSVFFDDACFGNTYGPTSIPGTVSDEGDLRGPLQDAIQTAALEADRIVYREVNGKMIVDFYDNSGEVESTMTAEYLGETDSVTINPVCEEPSAGVFTVATTNGEQTPIFLDLQYDGSIEVHRTRQVDFESTCRMVDAAGSWTTGTNTTSLDIGTGEYDLVGILPSNPNANDFIGDLDVERATKAEFASIKATPTCVDSELISLNFLFLPPTQFEVTGFDYSELVYDVLINGVNATGDEDSVSTDTVSDVAGAHTVEGVLFDSLTLYTATIEVYKTVDGVRLLLASRTLGEAMGGDAPFAPVPDNVDITEETKTIVIDGVEYVITGNAAYNVVDGEGYNVYFDADFDGIWNYVDPDPVSIDQ